MTPINPAAASGLPATSAMPMSTGGGQDFAANSPALGQQLPYMTPDTQGGGGAYQAQTLEYTGGTPNMQTLEYYPDTASYQSEPYIPTAAPGATLPYDPGMGVNAPMPHDAVAPSVDPMYADAYGGGGTEPTATIDDFAALGVFTQDDLLALYELGATPQELGLMYQDVVNELGLGEQGGQYVDPNSGTAVMPQDPGVMPQDPGVMPQSPEMQMQMPNLQGLAPQGGGVGHVDPTTGQPVATDPAVAGDPAAGTTPTGPPGWSDEWNSKFGALLREAGVFGSTYLTVMESIRNSGMSEQDLAATYELYATTPEGQAELATIAEASKSGKKMEYGMLGGMGVLAGGVALGGYLKGSSAGNVTNQMLKVAMHAGSTDDQLRIATQILGSQGTEASKVALDQIRAAGLKVTAPPVGQSAITKLRSEGVGLIADKAAKANGVKPILTGGHKAAMRNLSPSTKLSFKEAMQYGLGTKVGSNAKDVARAGASTAAGAVDDVARAGATATAGAADDVIRAGAKVAAGSADDVIRAGATAVGGGGSSAVASAAKGAGSIAKIGGGVSKALGPLGLLVGAGFGVYAINQTVKQEGEFGKESAKMTGNVAGGLAGGIAGAAAGAAIGSVVPVIGTGIGALVGGIIGGVGGSMAGEAAGGAIHDATDKK